MFSFNFFFFTFLTENEIFQHCLKLECFTWIYWSDRKYFIWHWFNDNLYFFSHCHLETAVVPKLLVSLSPLVQVLWLHCPSHNSIKALCYLHPCAFSKLSSFILALKFTPKRSYPLKKLLDEIPQEISSNINFPMILQLKVCVRVLYLLLLQIW